MNNKWKQFLFGLVALLILLPCQVLAIPANLNNIRVTHSDNSTRLEIALTQSQSYRVSTLSNPDRLVLELKETKLAIPLPLIPKQNPLMIAINSKYPDPSSLRLIIDLKQLVHCKISTESKKIILDLYSQRIVKLTQPKAIALPEPFRIVSDPGHGGKDPGAIGKNGTQEKKIVMGISHHLAKLINKQPGMRAVLTRKGDYFVPLRGRLRLAHKGKADLFVAIHADSYFNNRSSGASVYAISHRGATSEAARWLAQRENYSELGQVDLGELVDKSYVLRSVLIDLAQTATVKHSLHLGNTVLSALNEVTNLHYNQVEQAPFVVLKSPDIPSILVEIGFLSNPKEEERLRKKHYQEQMAQALFNGIQKYIKKYSVIKNA